MTNEDWIERIRMSGLFDLEWYLARNPDIRAAGIDPVQHWFYSASAEKRDPNFLFSVEYYLARNGGAFAGDANPLVHYITTGEGEGQNPSLYFDASWYWSAYGSEIGGSAHATALGHYLTQARGGEFSPNPYFSAKYYLETYPDIAAAGLRPYEHFLQNGGIEGRNPSDRFVTVFYRQRHRIGPAADAFTHFLEEGLKNGLVTHPDDEKTVFSESARWTAPGPQFKRELQPLPRRETEGASTVDVFAYYLPQFHPIPENDSAWGAGFTEWRNIARGLPRFEGHFQPRIPRDLGFYDLRAPASLDDQIALAEAAGLRGFGFYYYNFDGDRVLDLPIEIFMEAQTDLDFFLIWANENWTKTWDGFDRDVIKEQNFSLDSLDVIAADIGRHMRHENYYRIDGRPFFVLYRPGIIPEPKRYIARLREAIAEACGQTPLMFMVQGFGDTDPRVFGLDGAIEFPPHKIGQGLQPINDKVTMLDPGYRGMVFSYDDYVARSKDVGREPFPLVRTAMPMWDNEARRPGRGTVVYGSTPDKYRDWLSHLIRYAKRHPVFGRSVVAINAWNEWCEGTYLEPDVHYGVAYLQATSEAIHLAHAKRPTGSILLVGHDAYRHGAQLLLLNVARQLRSFGFRVAILLLRGGPMEDEYRAVSDYFRIIDGPRMLEETLGSPELSAYQVAITNTVVSGRVVPALKARSYKVVSLVHEMANLVRERNLEESCADIARFSDAVVFAADRVKRDFETVVGRPVASGRVWPQGIYKPPVETSATPAKASRRKVPVITNLGYADMRKGYDLFVSLADYFAANGIPGEFVWIGNVDPSLKEWVKPAGANFKHVSFTDDVYGHLRRADVFFLTSREDPFPTVALEALAVGVPVVCYAGTGGIADLVGSNEILGACARPFSLESAALELQRQIALDTAASRSERADLMRRDFSFSHYVYTLLEALDAAGPAVSAIVPNYNYEAYLTSRVESVLDQTYKPSQVLLLDDRSKDGSATVIAELCETHRPWIVPRLNTQNSGSPFAQWSAGVRLARGKYVWIAEADDLSEPTFLEETIAFMEANDCLLCFTDSKQIDTDGKVLADSYNYYFKTVHGEAFDKPFAMEGQQFLAELLSTKNLILNVSSVLWRRDALEDALAALEAELPKYKVAGDWRIYAHVSAREGARIGFIPKSLNVHRRHAASATHSQARNAQLNEIGQIHAVIKSLIKVPSRDVQTKQQAYIKELRDQFGLAVPQGERAAQRVLADSGLPR
jgi:glycosyltransferase involved in cell wall biosynthesis